MNKKCNKIKTILFLILQVGITIASPAHKRNFHAKSKPSKITQKLNSQTIKHLEDLLDANYQTIEDDDVILDVYDDLSSNDTDLLLDSENFDSAQDANLTRRHPLLFDWTTSCGVCDPNMCEPPPPNCLSGLIRDVCDCCYVCGNMEDSACDLDGEEFRFGSCGNGLICAPAPPNQVGPANSYCACASYQVICGSDGRTYLNPCRFKRATGRKTGLEKSHVGPCLSAPLVEIPPMNQTVESGGGSAVFSCSVSGYPLAWFEWLVDGENVFKQGFGEGISIQIRRGPLQYQVTTWLEIDHVTFRHSGVYTCSAKNMYGSSNASARLDVIGDNNAERRPHKYFYRGSKYDFGKTKTHIKQSETTVPQNYLQNHILPELNSGLAYLESANQDIEGATIDTIDQTNINPIEKYDISNSNNHDIKDIYAKALKEMLKPKPFKDIFFDDDEYSDGSGTEFN